MGRCQSTPGLVETKGRIPIEEMWLSQSVAQSAVSYGQQQQQSMIRYFSKQFLLKHFCINFSNVQRFRNDKQYNNKNCVFVSCRFSRAPSPRSTRGTEQIFERHCKAIDSPGSVSPSVHSSVDERPRSRAASHQSRPQSQPSRTGFQFLSIMSCREMNLNRNKREQINPITLVCPFHVLQSESLN